MSTHESVTLMLLGKTGSGKSALGNVILNQSDDDGFVVKGGLMSTMVYQAVAKVAELQGHVVRIVDTPGVMDTNDGVGGGKELAVRGICGGISRCSEGVDAFLIVLRLDVRLTKEEFESIAELEKLFGQGIWRYVILVFTHGEQVDNDAKKFDEKINVARQQMPQLEQLMSKLNTKPQMFDTGKKRQPDVVAKQLSRLLHAVDKLMSKNKKAYTNELFEAAQLELKMDEKLMKQQRDTDLELLRLKEKVSHLESNKEKYEENLETMRIEYKKKMEALEKKTADLNGQLEARLKEVSEKLEKMAKLWPCSIL